MLRKRITPISWTIALTFTILAAAHPAAPQEPAPNASLTTEISDSAYDLVSKRVQANREAFYVYRDHDSAFNHGVPSGFFGDLNRLALNAACIDDPAAADGCSANPNRIDMDRGTVLQVTFGALQAPFFAGINFEEPENWGVAPRGQGYDLTGSTALTFEARSPDGLSVDFGFGEAATGPFTLGTDWAKYTIPFSSLSPVQSLDNIYVLFTVVASAANAPQGGTVLLDDIRFEPTPDRQAGALSLPLSYETFGVVPRSNPAAGRVAFPVDQTTRNLATTYEAALTVLALLDRSTVEDVADAQRIADALAYASQNDNRGIRLPAASDGSTGLHNGYSGGDLALYNDQAPEGGRSGEIRPAGFGAGAEACGSAGYCLLLEGASGGNSAFAVISLLKSFLESGNTEHLEAARRIASWIADRMADPSRAGYGGFHAGYPDGHPNTLLKAKSTESNAKIFAAFTHLSKIEEQLGNTAAAERWLGEAESAGDFVMAMFNASSGCFSAGTVVAGTQPGPGIDPVEEPRGDDLINKFRFLDSNTSAILGLAPSQDYKDRINWRRPVQCILQNFAVSVTTDGTNFQGLGMVKKPAAGPDGIAWEFTAQAVSAMKLVDQMNGESLFGAKTALYLDQIRQAQLVAPFGDGRGIVASTLQEGESLPPLGHCLSTPFRCIPQRVELATTVWAIAAEQSINPLLLSLPVPPCEASGSTVCLHDGRFEIRAEAYDHSSPRRFFEAEFGPDLGDQSFVASFFNSSNKEQLGKVINGCGLNGYFWYFMGSTTDVEFVTTVRDTDSGLVRHYHNADFQSAPALTDTEAFSCGAASGSLLGVEDVVELVGSGASLGLVEESGSTAPCVPDTTTTCLLEGRFEVRTEAYDHSSPRQHFQAELGPDLGDQSFLASFFNPDNKEQLGKVLDGCILNDHFWFFLASTTDVEFTTTVRDTVTGLVREYHNDDFQRAPALTDTAAFPCVGAKLSNVIPPSR